MIKRLTLLVCSIMLLAGYVPSLPATSASPPDLPWQSKARPFGVVAALGNRVRTDEVDSAVALMQEAGVQWQREEIFWERIQKEPDGPFVWDGDGHGFYNYDQTIGAQVAAGIQVLGLLDYNPYWFKGKNPPPEAWIDDWGKFVFAAVSRYGRERGWIKHWELWNEPNLAPFGYESGLYEIKDFVKILEVGQAAAHAADPEAIIIMGGMSGVRESFSPFTYDQLDYLERVAELGGWNYVDAIGLHPYHIGPPESSIRRFDRIVTLKQELEHLDRLFERYGPKPVWITELGWSTYHDREFGVSERDQALFLIRAFLIALSHPSVETFFWYDFRNDTYPEAPYESPIYDDHHLEFHFGLLRRFYPFGAERDDIRKPSFVAFRTMTQQLGNLEIQPPQPTPWPGLHWYQFLGQGRRVDVLWNTGEGMPSGGGEVLVSDCDCRHAIVRGWDSALHFVIYPRDGTLTLRPAPNGEPIFVEYVPWSDTIDPGDPNVLFFEETGHKLRDGFADYWQQHGGLARFGYPITNELLESNPITGKLYVVQYFERVRLEYHPELVGTPESIQITPLGEQLLQRYGINWRELPRVEHAPPECLMVEETGHSLCPPFRGVWEDYGGAAFLGYPLTEPFDSTHRSTQTPYRVQYFEKARLELLFSPDGQPSGIQFGSLGRELFTGVGGMP